MEVIVLFFTLFYILKKHNYLFLAFKTCKMWSKRYTSNACFRYFFYIVIFCIFIFFHLFIKYIIQNKFLYHSTSVFRSTKTNAASAFPGIQIRCCDTCLEKWLCSETRLHSGWFHFSLLLILSLSFFFSTVMLFL